MILNSLLKITTFCGLSLITWWFSGFNILKVIFKSNSVSINKKTHINIKCALLNKTLHSVKSEIFSIKLWRKLTKFYPMTIISSYHKSEIQFFRNHTPCPRILKLIRRNKWFNPPDNENILDPSKTVKIYEKINKIATQDNVCPLKKPTQLIVKLVWPSKIHKK